MKKRKITTNQQTHTTHSQSDKQPRQNKEKHMKYYYSIIQEKKPFWFVMFCLKKYWVLMSF